MIFKWFEGIDQEYDSLNRYPDRIPTNEPKSVILGMVGQNNGQGLHLNVRDVAWHHTETGPMLRCSAQLQKLIENELIKCSNGHRTLIFLWFPW